MVNDDEETAIACDGLSLPVFCASQFIIHALDRIGITL